MKGERVQIPAYTDRWMMGDRFGVILSAGQNRFGRNIATVRLDKSGATVRVLLDDCE